MTHDRTELPSVLTEAETVLLDVDGPVCKVFAGVPASDVARRLRETYVAAHGPHVAAVLDNSDDPLEVIRDAAMRQVPHLSTLETALTSIERQAIKLAEPTPHADEAVSALQGSGFRLAAVSNNGTEAVRQYFADRGLDQIVEPLLGRPTDVRWMKPDPYLLRMALDSVGSTPEAAVFLGDSVTDIEAARAAGTQAIGYANKPEKVQTLKRAGADTIILSMAEIIEALKAAR